MRILLCLVVGLFGTGIVLRVIVFQDVTANCQRTNETRLGPTAYVIMGGVVIPVPSTERRYICENGDIWL